MPRSAPGPAAVQIYTAMVYHGLSLAARIARGLDALLARDGFANVAEAIGTDRGALAVDRPAAHASGPEYLAKMKGGQRSGLHPGKSIPELAVSERPVGHRGQRLHDAGDVEQL